VQEVEAPQRPDDHAAEEARRERGKQHGYHDPDVERRLPGGRRSRERVRWLRAPGEPHQATPQNRRDTIPPSRRTKAPIGSMTKAAVKIMIRRAYALLLDPMSACPSRSRDFASCVPKRFVV
jgi:hypothetical protein